MIGVLDAARAHALAARFAGTRVLIVGDVMLDHFVMGRVNRISPEAPVPVVEFQQEQFRLGGAANVAHNVRALGAEATLVGVVGRDGHADTLRGELEAIGIPSTTLVIAPDRPTTRKMRVVTTRNQQVARVDYEHDGDVDGDAAAALSAAALRACAGADVVLVSDYLKGVVTAPIMRALVAAAARRGIPLLVDPKIPHIDLYRGATLVTPNHHEAETATAMRIRTDPEAAASARAFQARAGCESVLVTRGEHGMWLLEGRWTDRPDAGGAAGAPAIVGEMALPAAAREVSDVTGAGDTVIATVALGLAAGGTLVESAALANYAAGVSVAKFGPATVSPAELLDQIDALAPKS